MARYIDLDKLLEILDSCRCTHCTNDKSEGCALCQYDDFKKAIQNAPAADVVPESEVERLKRICNSYALQYGTVRDQQKVIDEAKQEAAAKIFEEIAEIATLTHEFNSTKIYAKIDFEKLKELRKKYTKERPMKKNNSRWKALLWAL